MSNSANFCHIIVCISSTYCFCYSPYARHAAVCVTAHRVIASLPRVAWASSNFCLAASCQPCLPQSALLLGGREAVKKSHRIICPTHTWLATGYRQSYYPSALWCSFDAVSGCLGMPFVAHLPASWVLCSGDNALSHIRWISADICGPYACALLPVADVYFGPLQVKVAYVQTHAYTAPTCNCCDMYYTCARCWNLHRHWKRYPSCLVPA